MTLNTSAGQDQGPGFEPAGYDLHTADDLFHVSAQQENLFCWLLHHWGLLKWENELSEDCPLKTKCPFVFWSYFSWRMILSFSFFLTALCLKSSGGKFILQGQDCVCLSIKSCKNQCHRCSLNRANLSYYKVFKSWLNKVIFCYCSLFLLLLSFLLFENFIYVHDEILSYTFPIYFPKSPKHFSSKLHVLSPLITYLEQRVLYGRGAIQGGLGNLPATTPPKENEYPFPSNTNCQ